MRSVKCIVVFLLVLTVFASCKPDDKSKRKHDKDNECMAQIFFEEWDKDKTYDQLVEELGEWSYTEGSGIINFCWTFNDDSVAKVIFSKDKIVRMRVVNSKGESVYSYNRYDNGVGQDGLSQYISDMGMFAHYVDYILFDVTGDGEMDLCTTVTKGSGIVSNSVVVFDPVENIGYELSGRSEDIDYVLSGTDGGQLIVLKKRGVAYNDVDDIPAEGIEGRLSIENDKLVFVPV